MILHKWLAFYSAFLNIHRSGVLKRWHGWCHMKLLRSVYTIQPCTMSLSAKPLYYIYIYKVYACLAVTCHLHFWRNDRGLLHVTAVTQGWNRYRNKSQHRKLTPEKKILPPLLQGFKPATFQSWVRRSNHLAIPASVHTSGMFLAYSPWGIEYCETDFRLNGGRPVNKMAPVAVLWK